MCVADIRFFPRSARLWRYVRLLAFSLALLGAARASSAGGAATRPSRAAPKRVLLLHSFALHVAPFSFYAEEFRGELTALLGGPVDFYEVSLDSARFADGEQDAPFVEYLRAMFADRRVDLVIPLGGPAARFAQRNRKRLFPNTPLLIAAVDQRHLNEPALTDNDAVVAVRNDPLKVIEDILRVLPKTENIVVVLGTSPLEKFWLGEVRREVTALSNRVRFTWWNELSFEEMRKRAAALPPRSAIFYGVLTVDAADVLHKESQTLTDLYAVANAPIFGLHDYQLGRGVVGGPLLPVRQSSHDAADVANRILGGELPRGLTTPVLGPGIPAYDWRELHRWNIDERNLPAGSVIQFRQPTFWQQHRSGIFALIAFCVTAALIGLLLLMNYTKRRRAEGSLRESEERFRLQRDELAHLSRVAMLGELSGSLAHELNQPLTAILSNAEAAQRFMDHEPANLKEVRSILQDIVQDDNRAGEIIRRLRLLFKKGELQRNELDVNEAIREVLKLVNSDLLNHGVAIDAEFGNELPRVLADRVQVQQVLLNLIVNGCDAMAETNEHERRLRVRTESANGSGVQISVADRGCGIPPGELDKIFTPFFTTKPHGLGLGLSVCRTIVSAHGGTLWATNNSSQGASFHLTLPSATAKATS